MSVNFSLLLLSSFLISAGSFMLMSKSLSRILFGILIASNGLNIFLIGLSGSAGNAPIRDLKTNSTKEIADPLAQAMVLTGIVIPMGLVAFCLALLYRYVKITKSEKISDDSSSTIDKNLASSEAELLDSEIEENGK